MVDPTATPAAVDAICANIPGCLGCGAGGCAGGAGAGALAGTFLDGAGDGDGDRVENERPPEGDEDLDRPPRGIMATVVFLVLCESVLFGSLSTFT